MYLTDDPYRLHVFQESKKSRKLVGELIYNTDSHAYEFHYDKKYRASKAAIALGPSFPLNEGVHISKKRQLFPELLDNISGNLGNLYVNDINEMSPEMQFARIALYKRYDFGAHTFIFSNAYKEDFFAEDIIRFRMVTGVSQASLAKALGIQKETLQRIEAAVGKNTNAMELLKIYFRFPEVALWKLRQSKGSIHEEDFNSLTRHFKILRNSHWAENN